MPQACDFAEEGYGLFWRYRNREFPNKRRPRFLGRIRATCRASHDLSRDDGSDKRYYIGKIHAAIEKRPRPDESFVGTSGGSVRQTSKWDRRIAAEAGGPELFQYYFFVREYGREPQDFDDLFEGVGAAIILKESERGLV
jgi:hypothetical protein